MSKRYIDEHNKWLKKIVTESDFMGVPPESEAPFVRSPETIPNGDGSGGEDASLSSVSPPTNKKGEQNE